MADGDVEPQPTLPPSATWPRTATVMTVGGLVAAAVAIGFRRLGDPDLPWHLAVGRGMVAARAIPRSDDLTYTFRGTPYPSEYLSELVLWLAWRAGGGVGLQVLAVLCVGVIAWLITDRCRAAGAFAAAAAALALSASELFFVVRPALLSFALLAAALAIVDRQRLRGGRVLWLLVPLQLAWSAVHGFALLGALVAVGYAGYAFACRLARGQLGSLLPPRDARAAGTAAAVAVLAVLATSAGPVGPGLFLTPFKAVEYGGYLTEWSPVTARFVLLHDPAFGVLALLALVALVAGREPAGAASGSRLPSLFDAALVLGPLSLALLRTRLVPVFAIAAAPVLARRLAPVLRRARLGPLLAVTSSLVAAPAILLSPGSHLGAGFDEQRLPERAVGWIEQHRPAGPVWNFLSFGGWIEWRLHPGVRAFIDGRTSYLFPFSFFRDYAQAEHDPARFQQLLRRWKFEWALVAAGPFDRFSEPIADDPAWALVHLDEVAAVYVREEGVNRDLAGGSYRVLRHLVDTQALFAAPAEALAHDAGLALSDQPDSPRAHLVAAIAAWASGDLAAARSERDAVEAADPRYPGLRELDARLPPAGAGRAPR